MSFLEKKKTDLIEEFLEAHTDGDETTELLNLLLDLTHYVDFMSEEFYNKLVNELDEWYEWIKNNVEIKKVDKQITVTEKEVVIRS